MEKLNFLVIFIIRKKLLNALPKTVFTNVSKSNCGSVVNEVGFEFLDLSLTPIMWQIMDDCFRQVVYFLP